MDDIAFVVDDEPIHRDEKGEEYFDWIQDAEGCDLVLDVDNLSDKCLLGALRSLVAAWICEVPPDRLMTHAMNAFGLDDFSNVDHKMVQQFAAKQVVLVGHLYRLLNIRDLLNQGDENGGQARLEYFHRIFNVITELRKFLQSAAAAMTTMSTERNMARPDGDIAQTHFLCGVEDDFVPVQSLVVFMLELLRQRGYRKFEDECWEQVKINRNGRPQDTHAWHRVCSLKEFVYDNVRMQIEYRQWLNLTKSRKMADDVVAMILESQQFDFPDLKLNRELYSCRDGLYSLRHAFFPWGEEASWGDIAEEAQRVWQSKPGFEGFQVEAPTKMDCAVMYIDEEFGTFDLHEDGGIVTHNWGSPYLLSMDREEVDAAISTPAMDDLLRPQVDITPRDRHWLFALTGQALRPKGWEGENWQVMLVLKGTAGTGKSTYLNQLLSFFPTSKIGTISSSNEETFGLEALYDKWINVWPEAKDRPGIPQHDMQSMITGDEMVSVRRKNKTAHSMKWNIPIVVATNVLVKWDDPRGAMTRRLAIIPFDTVVAEPSGDLPLRLVTERLRALVKWNAMFCSMLIAYKGKSIWKSKEEYIDAHGSRAWRRIVGDAMYSAHEEARKALDICLRFLKECTTLEFDFLQEDEGRIMTKKEFMAEFTSWKEASGLAKEQWVFKQDSIQSAFEEMRIVYDARYDHEDGGPPIEAIRGVCLRADPEM